MLQEWEGEADASMASGGSGGGGGKAAGGAATGGVSLWDAAFATVRGLWLSGWNELGYWYSTPEAWELKGNYRSLGYMRPLSVWAMQWAIEKQGLLAKRQDFQKARDAASAKGGAGARATAVRSGDADDDDDDDDDDVAKAEAEAVAEIAAAEAEAAAAKRKGAEEK